MKRVGVSILLAVSLLVIVLPPFSAQASLPGIEDYTNERIVPLLISPTSAGADGSGFLYSSRIVFTSAHTAVTFDSNGKMVDFREIKPVIKEICENLEKKIFIPRLDSNI